MFWGRTMLRIIGVALCCGIFAFGTAHGSPVDEAKSIYVEAQTLLASASRARPKDRSKAYVRAARKFARAYALIVARNLKESAPNLVKQLEEKIAKLARVPEIVAARKESTTRAISAAAEGRLTDAYDAFARLRDLDPRNRKIDYILGVIGQRMDGK